MNAKKTKVTGLPKDHNCGVYILRICESSTEAKDYTNYAKSTIISTETHICLIRYNSIKTKLI